MTSVPDSKLNFVEIVRRWASDEPEKRAYTFLEFRPETRESHVTYRELDVQARTIAARLQAHTQSGDRVLLLFRPGLEFIAGFLGCLYAGVIAVPANVARQGHGVERLKKIVKDAAPAVILSITSLKTLQTTFEGEHPPVWICSDEVSSSDPGHWQAPAVRMDDVAFLQYSSGSTGEPKGVMVTHGNLAHQSAVMYAAAHATHESCMVSWLPAFHDMGLILGILLPLFGGFPGVLMSPESFGEDPYSWLKAISDHWADISAAPNFAYEMSMRRISPEQRRTLDLSSWRVAVNGAESVRPKTIDDFTAAFSDCGFRRDAFIPAYGLAEGTLVVTCVERDVEPVEKSFSPEDLEYNMAVLADASEAKARKLVCCGAPVPGNNVLIVDPETRSTKDAMEIGEIWVSGPSVAHGYWQNPEQTEFTFHAYTAAGEGPYLRTGDLGFLFEGELFICGRLKDLILIRGRNHHAPDIEVTVESAHPALRRSCGVAFAVDVADEERLVIVQEIDRSFKVTTLEEFEGIIAAIRQAIAERHEIQVYSVVLIRHGTMPKTSSGKVRRRECRARYLEARLAVRASWDAHTKPGEPANTASPGSTEKPRDNSEAPDALKDIQNWLINELVSRAGCDQSAVSGQKSFDEMGLTAEAAMKLVRAMEIQFQCMLPLTLLAEFPTLDGLANHLYMTTSKKADSGAALEMTRTAQTSRPAVTLNNEPIAIVGLGCRFPGANGIQQFWKMLCDGVDAVSEVPRDRWDIDELYDPNPLAPGKMSTRCGGFLKDIDLMDRNFFEISVREAVRMDPQHRLIMEVAWESLEDAGITREKLSGAPVGVFIGISSSDYAQMQMGDPRMADAYGGLGSALTIAASRVSHFLNLRGPAIAVDTACSSSLSAVHLACASIRNGECELALAGGVNVLLSPVTTMFLTKAGMMSPDGRCKAFDSRANGYVRSEGAGVAVLKPLSRAMADGDPIYAVIRGIASNQDGHSSGLAAPNGEAQEAVILAACKNAGISPCDFDYVEAHGTGTPVGDPIEANALGAVLGVNRAPENVCPVGSVKTNVGHAESAAGMASLIKTALVLKNRLIPPSLHFLQPNPHIPFDSLPIRVQTTLAPMPERSRPLLAGVNGFGVGGTNVHAVLEEAPLTSGLHRDQRNNQGRTFFVLPISGASQASVQKNARCLAEYLRQAGNSAELADIGFTLGARRNHLKYRLAAAGTNATELADALAAYADQGHHPSVVTGTSATQARPRLAFIFSGQGSQWLGMGRGLMECEEVFRDVMEQCDALLQAHTGWSLIKEVMAELANSRIDETEIAQPAIFAVQVALAALWRSWGVVPDAVAGHSVGEVAAAHVAGALSLPEAIKLIAIRARLMQTATGMGKMASVELPPAELEQMLNGYGDRLSIAAVNSPSSVVVSGEPEALAQLLEILHAQGVTTVPLPVNYAFHSAQMETPRHELVAALADLEFRVMQIPMCSTVTGAWASNLSLGANYWGANLRQPVLLKNAIEAMAKDGVQVFMEIGAHPVVSGSISRSLKAMGCQAAVVPNLRRDQDERLAIASALAMLYTSGHQCDWTAIYPNSTLCRTLPSYQWDRQRYWLDGKKAAGRNEIHPMLGARLPVAQPVWQHKIDFQAMPFLREVHVKQRAFLQAGYPAALACAAAEEAGATCQLTDVKFHCHLELPEGEATPLIQSTVFSSDGEKSIRVSSCSSDSQNDNESWTTLLTARCMTPMANKCHAPRPLSLEQIQNACREQVSGADFYRNLEISGIHMGEGLRAAEHVWIGEHAGLFKMVIKEDVWTGMEGHSIHPVIVECASQACRLVYGLQGGQLDLSHMERLHIFAPSQPSFYVYVCLRSIPETGEEFARTDVYVANEEGQVNTWLEGVQFAPRANEPRLGVPTDPKDWLYDIAWHPTPRPQKKDNASPGQGSWLILADSSGCGSQVVELLRTQGQRCITIHRGEEFQQLAPESFMVSAANPEDMRRVLAASLTASSPACKGIVHMWSMDSAPTERASAESIAEDLGFGAISIVYTLQAIAATEFSRPPRLLTVTQGAQRVQDEDPPVSFSQTTVWGLGKVITLEHPELRCCRIDLSAHSTQEEIAALVQECLVNDHEDQVAFRGKERYVARLVRHVLKADAGGAVAPQPLTAETDLLKYGAFHLDRSFVDNDPIAVISPASRRYPGAGEIEIRISAASLDARDGLRQPNGAGTAWLSSECAGTIVKVGPGVADFHVGQEVIALAQGSITLYLTMKSFLAVSRPETLTSEQAVSSARAFITAFHALNDVARLSEGETVLIHGAGKGTGLAAIQIARWLGANVIATIEHSQERDLLEQWSIQHVFQAGSSGFRAEVLKLTQGKGVEVFLNCIEGASMAEFLPLLRACGRCIDVASQAAQAGAGRVKLLNNVSFCAVDMDRLQEERPMHVRSLLQTAMSYLRARTFTPLPCKSVSVGQVPAALQRLTESEVQGAIAVSLPVIDSSQEPEPLFRDNGTFLITGGLGGLGLTIALRMVERGARHMALVGRSAPSSSALEQIAQMRTLGASIQILSADVSEEQQVRRILATIEDAMPPLRGVVHAAGVLGNGLLINQDETRFRSVMPAKVTGAWHLHQLTADKPLDFFVLFSSLAGLIGSHGQSNYSAANAFLDGLATYRQAKGMPALSIGWGPWSEVGMASDAHNEKRLKDLGMGMLAPGKALELFERLLQESGGHIGAISMDWQLWSKAFPAAADARFVSGLIPGRDRAQSSSGMLKLSALEGLEPEARAQRVEEAIHKAICQTLRLDPGVLAMNVPLSAVGLDSIVALELKSRIEANVDVVVHTPSLLKGPTVQQLAAHLLAQMFAADEPSPADANVGAPITQQAETHEAQTLLDSVEDLSEEEVNSLLSRMNAAAGD